MRYVAADGTSRRIPLVSALITLALINDFVVAALFSPDGELSARTTWLVRLIGVLAAGGVFAAIRMWRASWSAGLVGVMRRHPRLSVSAVSLGALCILLCALELGFHSANTVRARKAGIAHDAPELVAGKVAAARLVVRDELVYEVLYSLDDDGYRVTPIQDRDPVPARTILFFGGSFVFGEGVGDNETIPWFVGSGCNDCRVRNRAFPGHGPSQMLRQLETDEALSTLPGEVWAVYVFIPGHVRRATGSMRVATAWGRDFADYRSADRDEVEYAGTFTSARPVLSRVYGAVSRERVLRYFNVDLPLRVSGAHLEHTARIIGTARDQFSRHHNRQKFVVAIYPRHPKDEFPGSRLVPFLESLGIRSIDLSKVFDSHDEQLWLPHDLHPNVRANRLLANELARKLSF